MLLIDENALYARWEWYPDCKDRQELLCTNCGAGCPYDIDGQYDITPRCPHCGAHMCFGETSS